MLPEIEAVAHDPDPHYGSRTQKSIALSDSMLEGQRDSKMKSGKAKCQVQAVAEKLKKGQEKDGDRREQ